MNNVAAIGVSLLFLSLGLALVLLLGGGVLLVLLAIMALGGVVTKAAVAQVQYQRYRQSASEEFDLLVAEKDSQFPGTQLIDEVINDGTPEPVSNSEFIDMLFGL
jgi:hypothetical protein